MADNQCAREGCERNGTHYPAVHLYGAGAPVMARPATLELFSLRTCRDHAIVDPRLFFDNDNGQALCAAALRTQGQGPHVDWERCRVEAKRWDSASALRRAARAEETKRKKEQS